MSDVTKMSVMTVTRNASVTVGKISAYAVTRPVSERVAKVSAYAVTRLAPSAPLTRKRRTMSFPFA